MSALLSHAHEPAASPLARVQTFADSEGADTRAMHEQVLQHLNERGYVPFHRTVSDRWGHRAALFIGACLYWTRYSLTHSPKREGWFYMPVQKMTEATTLTRREQETVRQTLREAGVLEERQGKAGVLNYRIHLRRLAVSLEVLSVPPDEEFDLEQAWSMFGSTVSFYRPLADLTGSAASGLYLSWLLGVQRQMLTAEKGKPRYLHIDARAVADGLGLTAKVMRSARESLRKAGFIVERGIWVDPNLPAILACIQSQTVKPLPGKEAEQEPATQAREKVPTRELAPSPAIGREPSQPHQPRFLRQPDLPLNAIASRGSAHPAWHGLSFAVAGNSQLAEDQALDQGDSNNSSQPLDTVAQNAEPEVAQNANPVDNFPGRVAQNANPDAQNAVRVAQNANPTLPKTPIHIQIQNKYYTNTTTNARASAGPVDNFESEMPACRRRLEENKKTKSPQGLEGLIYPAELSAQVLPGIQDVLRRVSPPDRQPLLDELQGHLRIPGKPIHNPAGWLAAVAKRLEQGMTLPLAESVAALRREQAAVREQIGNAVANGESKASHQAKPAFDAEAARAHKAWLIAERKRRGI